MRAHVYRHVEGQSTIGGVGLSAFVAVLGVAFGAIQLLSFGPSLLAIAATYVGLRVMGQGRPPLFWQHLLVFKLRQRLAGGRLCARARCRSPQFPFGPYRSRHPSTTGAH